MWESIRTVGKLFRCKTTGNNFSHAQVVYRCRGKFNTRWVEKRCLACDKILPSRFFVVVDVKVKSFATFDFCEWNSIHKSFTLRFKCVISNYKVLDFIFQTRPTRFFWPCKFHSTIRRADPTKRQTLLYAYKRQWKSQKKTEFHWRLMTSLG